MARGIGLARGLWAQFLTAGYEDRHGGLSLRLMATGRAKVVGGNPRKSAIQTKGVDGRQGMRRTQQGETMKRRVGRWVTHTAGWGRDGHARVAGWSRWATHGRLGNAVGDGRAVGGSHLLPLASYLGIGLAVGRCGVIREIP